MLKDGATPPAPPPPPLGVDAVVVVVVVSVYVMNSVKCFVHMTNNATITVPNNVTNATINVASLMNTTGNTSTATLNGGINVTVNTTLGNVSIEIPQNIAISGSTSWNGIINLPTIKETASTNPAPSSGKTVNTGTISVIEIGFGDIELTFDKAVRILVPGKAGQLVGYSRSGVFTPITNVCLADTQAFGDALPDGGDCKMDVGSDLLFEGITTSVFDSSTRVSFSRFVWESEDRVVIAASM